MTLIQDFTAGYAPQVFPATTTAMQAVFPSALNALCYLCNDSSGDLSEAHGGPAFSAQGGPKYGLATPFASGKSAIEIVDGGSQFQNASTTAFDPAGGSLTLLAAFRVEHIRPGNSAICGKYAAGIGYIVYIDSSDRINILYSDGSHSSTLTTAQSDYGQGAYHLVAVVFNLAGSVTIYTDEETATQNVPNGFSWPAFTNSSAATLGNANANGDPLYGSIAYFAGFAGTVTQQQYNAWLSYGTPSAWSSLTYTPPNPGSWIGLSTFDWRDPLNPRVRKHGRAQIPLEAPIDRFALARLQPVSNQLAQPEEINGSSWTTNGSGLYVEPHQGPDPGYGYNACTLSKPAPGVTPSRRQTASGLFAQGYFLGSVWLRTADAQPHTATLQLTTNGDGGGAVYSSTVVVNGTWQLVSISSNFVLYSSGSSAVFDIFPADLSNANAVGSVQAWGAQVLVAAQSGNLAPPCYAVTTSSIGTPGGTGALFSATNGYVRCVYVSASKPSGDMPLIEIVPVGGLGGLRLYLNSSIRLLNAVILNTSGTGIYTQPYWDTRTTNAIGKRTDAVMSWDFSVSTRQGAGTGRVRIAIDGSAPGGLMEDPASATSWPPGISGGYTIGYDSVNGVLPGCSIERIEFGAAPGAISRASSKASTESYYGSKLLRIGCFGDSITGFADSYHQLLTLLLGRDVSVVVNYGLSGNRISALGGVVQNLFPGTVQSRFQYDFLQGQFDEVILFAGINDILFDSETDATAIGRLADLINMFATAGVKVRVNTLTPARNNTFGSWTSQKGAYIQNFNAAIKAGLPNVSSVCDLYSFFDDGTGQYRGGVGGLLSYDGLHPTHGISGNNGPGADAMALLMFAQHYGNRPLSPSGSAPQVLSYSTQRGPLGSSVVITGSNFSPQVYAVDFCGIPATTYVVNSPSQITATVPTGVFSGGPIGVSTANGRVFGPSFSVV